MSLCERLLTSIDLTWHGHKIHQGPEVDELIARCDFDNHNEPEELERAAGPFKVFWAPTGNPQSLFDIPNASRKDTKLFRELYHHYFTVTAQNMMPFKDTRNPWRSVYPCLARRNAFKGQQALYYAMFAQAAGNLAQLGSRRDEMSRLATKYYAISLQSLWASLGDMDFCSVLASSATLMMAEVRSYPPYFRLTLLRKHRYIQEYPIHGEPISMEHGACSCHGRTKNSGKDQKKRGLLLKVCAWSKFEPIPCNNPIYGVPMMKRW